MIKEDNDFLYQMNTEELLIFIRDMLEFDPKINDQLRYTNKGDWYKEHRRFDMSGYDGNKTGDCTIENLDILNQFARFGIYDHTSYLFLDFYKGIGTLYYRYFTEENNYEEELSGLGTVEIILFIMNKTIFSGKPKRRR